MSRDFKKRRVFITTGSKHYQLFTLVQGRNDASIYVSSPTFTEIKWWHVTGTDLDSRLIIADSPGDGKLSVHQTGMSAIRAHDNPHGHALVVHGNYLISHPEQSARVRHLFTALIAEPSHVANSTASNRLGDVSFLAEHLRPYVLVFFAVPRIRQLTVEIAASFSANDLDKVPPDGSFGSFNLTLHAIAWFAYRTKYMDKWPIHPQISYGDGFKIPLFIGTGDGKCRLEFRVPRYELNESELRIEF